MPRRRDPDAPRVVHRTARVGVRVTRAQRERCFGLLRSAADVWACVLEVNHWRWRHDAAPLVAYQELCRELAVSGPGVFGDLDSVGARSVLRRYSDAWFAAAKRRKAGDPSARFPRRRRGLLPVRYYHGTYTLAEQRLRLPTARGTAPLRLRLDRFVPYPMEQVRSVTLLAEGGRLWVEVTAEVPVTVYPAGTGPDPERVAGVDLGVIHPYAVAGPDGHGLLVSGRASAPSIGCTWPTRSGGVGRPLAGHRSLASGGRGGGGKPAAGPASSKAATSAASGRRSMRRRRPSSAGQSSSGLGR